MAKPRTRERRGWAFTFAVAVVKPLLLVFTRHRWTAGSKRPAGGGAVRRGRPGEGAQRLAAEAHERYRVRELAEVPRYAHAG